MPTLKLKGENKFLLVQEDEIGYVITCPKCNETASAPRHLFIIEDEKLSVGVSLACRKCQTHLLIKDNEVTIMSWPPVFPTV